MAFLFYEKIYSFFWFFIYNRRSLSFAVLTPVKYDLDIYQKRRCLGNSAMKNHAEGWKVGNWFSKTRQQK